jgi:hydroxypyruvate isomerase
MQRRDFLRTSMVAGAATTVGAGPLDLLESQARGRREFKLDYAPHFGMFENLAGKDLLDQIRFMHDAGFRAFEDNGMKGRPVAVQEAIGNELARLGMRMGVFVAHPIYWNEPNLTNGDPDKREEFLQAIRDSVEVAKRVNAKWMTVVPGHVDLRLEMDFQTANVVESLRRACEILEPHGLVMVLEPLNHWRDHPGQYLSRIPQSYLVCRAVNSPSCKILFDIYHQQIQEGNLIPNMDRAWEEIGYFQIGDNPGRKEPTTGEINYRNVFRHIHSRGWDGIMGMEHGNSRPGAEGEQAVIDAYVEVDGFDV